MYKLQIIKKIPNIPCKTSSDQGINLNISHGGKGICKKNPNLHAIPLSSAP